MGQRPRILIVDNDPGMRSYVRSCLVPLEADVVEAADGLAALELLRAGDDPVDLVLTDVVMPQVSGLELARRIESDPALEGLKVLLVTGDAGEAERAERPVLLKPFNGSLLRACVAELLEPTDEDRS